MFACIYHNSKYVYVLKVQGIKIGSEENILILCTNIWNCKFYLTFFLNALLDVNLHILSHSQNQIFIKLIKMFEVKSFQYLIDHTKLQGTPFVNVIFNYKKVISMNIHIYFFNLHSENRYIVSFIIWEIRKWSFKIWLLSYGTSYAKRNWGQSVIIHRKTVKLLFRSHFNFKLVFYAYKL